MGSQLISPSIEICVKEELVGAGRGTVYWEHITKLLNINPEVMANIIDYATKSATEIVGNQEITFDTFLLILNL